LKDIGKVNKILYFYSKIFDNLDKTIMKGILIRKEVNEDLKSINEINDLAFDQNQESDLIDKLRKKAEFSDELSLVAIYGDKIVGHILFFMVSIIFEKGIHTTLSLGPVSVLPEHQNKGIGGELIRAGLKRAKELGFKSVVVLGHPEYYPRFGFRRASEWNIKDPFGAPEEAMMASELEKGSLDFGGGIIDYPQEYFETV
jgi:predicted N-acetyltransferase YhbS